MSEDAFDLVEVVASDVKEFDYHRPVVDKITGETTYEPTGWKIKLAGPGHKATRDVQNETTREQLELARRIEAARSNGKRWKPDDVDVDGARLRQIDRICKRILGWTRVSFNGEEFAPTPENIRRLMVEPRFINVQTFIMEQLADDARFLTN